MESRTLGQQDVHLWLASNDSPLNSNQYTRSVLSSYCDTTERALEFILGEHGKPALRQPAATATVPEFNLSHSGDWTVLAVSGGAPVGVDIQHTVTRQNEMKLARRFFSAAEFEALALLSDAQRANRFYDLWALKEAAVKARGEALPPQLSRRCFSVLAGESGLSPQALRADCDAAPDRAHYALYRPLPEYRLALCWLSDTDVPPRVRLFREGPSEAVELPVPAPLAYSAVER